MVRQCPQQSNHIMMSVPGKLTAKYLGQSEISKQRVAKLIDKYSRLQARSERDERRRKQTKAKPL
jgi:hypothetical protein